VVQKVRSLNPENSRFCRGGDRNN